MKTCKECNETKELSEFPAAKKRKDGSILYKNFCKSCQSAKDKVRYHALPEEKKKERNKLNRAKLGSDYFKNYKLEKLYGITLEDFKKRLDLQNNKCYICGCKFEGKKDTRVDHNHETGEVRKILCHNCNALIGHSKEDERILRNAMKYLEEHNL